MPFFFYFARFLYWRIRSNGDFVGGGKGNWGGLWNFLGLNFGFLDAIFWTFFWPLKKRLLVFFLAKFSHLECFQNG